MTQEGSFCRKAVSCFASACLAVMLMPSVPLAFAQANSGTVDCGAGWTLRYAEEDGQATITGYAFSGSGTAPLVIPATAGGAKVTAVNANAFLDCKNLSTVALPETVETLGSQCFKGSSITSVSIGSGIQVVDKYAFANCVSLTTVDFASGAHPEYFGDYAFSGDAALKELDIPAMLGTAHRSSWNYRLGRGCFSSCKGLEKVTFQAGSANYGRDYFDATVYSPFYDCNPATVIISHVAVNTTATYVSKTGFNDTYYTVGFYSSKAQAQADTTMTKASATLLVKRGTSLQSISTGVLSSGDVYGSSKSVPSPGAGSVWAVEQVSPAYTGTGGSTPSSAATATVSSVCIAYPVDPKDMTYAVVTSPEMKAYNAVGSGSIYPNSAYFRLRYDGSVDLSSIAVYSYDGALVDSSDYTLSYERGTYSGQYKEYTYTPLASSAEVNAEGAYRVTARGVGAYAGSSSEPAVFYVKRYDGAVTDCSGGSAGSCLAVASKAAAANLDRESVKFMVMAPLSNWQACMVGTALAGAGSGLCVFSDGTDANDGTYQALVAANTDHMIFVGPASEIGTSAIKRAKMVAGGEDGSFSYFDEDDAETLANTVYANVKKYGPRADDPYQWGEVAVVVTGSSSINVTASAQYVYENQAPVFFTAKDGSLSKETLANLADFEQVAVFGSEGAVSASALDSIAAQGCQVTRLGDVDSAVAACITCCEAGDRTLKTVAIASSDEAANGCAAAQYAALSGGAAFEVSSTSEAKQLQQYLVAAGADDILDVAVVGSFAAIDAAITERVASIWATPLSSVVGVGDTFVVDGVLYKDLGSGKARLERVLNAELTSVSAKGSIFLGSAEYTVGSVAAGAFRGRAALEAVTLPSSLKAIPADMFAGCTGLTKMSFSATSIGARAFQGCASLKSVVVTGSLTSVAASAFQGCTALKSVSLGGSSLKTIGAGAFQDCGKLTSMTIKSSKLSKVGSKALSGTPAKLVVKCPKAKVSAYKKLLKKAGMSSKATVKKI